jgi:hypothetical protein
MAQPNPCRYKIKHRRMITPIPKRQHTLNQVAKNVGLIIRVSECRDWSMMILHPRFNLHGSWQFGKQIRILIGIGQ